MSDAVKSAPTKSITPKPRPKPAVKPAPKPTGELPAGNRGVSPVKPSGPSSADNVKLSKEVDEPAVSPDTAAFLKNLQEAHKGGANSPPTAGDRVIADARSHLGTKSQDIDAPNYRNTGGNTNNCANFASTMLANQGQFPERVENVREMERIAAENGWRLVDQDQAGPGDMAFRTDVSHVELVSQAGGTHTIGSNNENPDNPGTVVNGQQWVTERPTEGHEFRFYTNRPAEEN
jgi:putative amidase-like protein